MNAAEKDDFAHALGQTLEFYGKELEPRDFSFWYRALADKPVESIKNALLEYVKIGKHAPRPANILELIAETAIPARQEALPKPLTTDCPPEIAAAWSWFLGRYTLPGKLQLFEDQGDIPLDLQEKYLHIVNHEAKKYGHPDAIPDELKLKEVWG